MQQSWSQIKNDSHAAFFMMKFLIHIQAWAHLLSMLTTWSAACTCCAKTSRKRSEWSECSSMWLNETEGLQSKINSRINWFLDSFYCCTFLSFINWSRKGQNRNVPLSSGKLPVFSSLLGKMPTLYSCCIFLTLAHSLGIWGGVKTNECPAQVSTLRIFFMHWQKNK